MVVALDVDAAGKPLAADGALAICRRQRQHSKFKQHIMQSTESHLTDYLFKIF